MFSINPDCLVTLAKRGVVLCCEVFTFCPSAGKAEPP